MGTPRAWTDAAEQALRRPTPTNAQLAEPPAPHWVCADCGDPCACQGTDTGPHVRCGRAITIQLPYIDHHPAL